MRANGSRVSSDRQHSGLATDHFPGERLSVTVDFKDDRGGPAGVHPRRLPHRHDYHELIWNRRGTGRHLIDGRPHTIAPGTLTIVGRGQVHVFESGFGLSGAIVRFTDESLGDRSVLDHLPAWLLDVDDSRTIAVPEREAVRLEGLLRMLDEESRHPVDRVNVRLQHHLLSCLLLLLERWHRTEAADGSVESRDVQVYRRFLRLLEEDFDRHHDTQHYAERLKLPAAALSRALARVSGRTTKDLVTERVMLEAARLLRFSDLTVGQIAFQAGFADPFYFSRAFKRRYGAAPLSYRARSRGIALTPPPQNRRADAVEQEKSR